MAQFNKLDVLLTIRETGLIPVFYHKDPATACKIVEACYEGGIRVFEFTNRGDFACEVFAALAKYARTECPELILGAGSVVDAPTAALYLQSGADFIVAPCFDAEVSRLCNRRGIPYVPGCGSVTEIVYAQEAGCELVKLFPAGSVGGPSFVKNVRGPLPWPMFLATGAVQPAEENLKEWFEAGVTCVGMGSQLFSTSEIETEQWESIARKCRAALDTIRRCRAKRD